MPPPRGSKGSMCGGVRTCGGLMTNTPKTLIPLITTEGGSQQYISETKESSKNLQAKDTNSMHQVFPYTLYNKTIVEASEKCSWFRK